MAEREIPMLHAPPEPSSGGCSVVKRQEDADGGYGDPRIKAEVDRLVEEETRWRVSKPADALGVFHPLDPKLREINELLVHSSTCRCPNCQYPDCCKLKGLFRHGMQCETRASGKCPLCIKMWFLLQVHAQTCKESDCSVPRCKDLKEYLKRLQQQYGSIHRAAAMEILRRRMQKLQELLNN